jgi:hypothetical protein
MVFLRGRGAVLLCGPALRWYVCAELAGSGMCVGRPCCGMCAQSLRAVVCVWARVFLHCVELGVMGDASNIFFHLFLPISLPIITYLKMSSPIYLYLLH